MSRDERLENFNVGGVGDFSESGKGLLVIPDLIWDSG